MRSREDKVLDAFVRVIALLDVESAIIVARPDRDPHSSGGCEAIVDRRGVRYALEHTTFDSFSKQRLSNARFMRSWAPPSVASKGPIRVFASR